MFSLPLLNLNLSLFRVISFFAGVRLKRWETSFRRVLTLFTIISSCGEYYWKLSTVMIPVGEIPYCSGNLKGSAEKSNTESLITGIFEVVTVSSSVLLMKFYDRENRVKRSYNVAVNLARRQFISTMRLFLPYSLFHAFSFLSFSLLSSAYREIFRNLSEPFYSAGSGLCFIPQYFTMISPLILYSIVVKSEQNRVTKTATLIHLQVKANVLYFEHYRTMWEEKENPVKRGILHSTLGVLWKFKNRKVTPIS